MKTEFEKIKAALLANRGGLTEASDPQIQTLWQSLPEAVRQQYLESVKTKEHKNSRTQEPRNSRT